MREVRCAKCGSLLAKIESVEGVIEIKCRKCKTTNRVTIPKVSKPEKA